MNTEKLFQPSEWLTTGQAARELRIAPGTLSNWRTKSIGPAFIKRGNNVFYSKDSIRNYLQSECGIYQSTSEWKQEKSE